MGSGRRYKVSEIDASLVERFEEVFRHDCAAAAAFSRGTLSDHGGGPGVVGGGGFGRACRQFVGTAVVASPGRRRGRSDAADSVCSAIVAGAWLGVLCG